MTSLISRRRAFAGRRGGFERGAGIAAILPPAAALLSMTIGVYIVATTAVMMIRGWSAMPYSDQWDELVLGPRQVLSPWLYSQHNEHRILFPRLLFAIDTLAFGGTNKFNLFSNFMLALALAGLIIYLVYKADGNITYTFWTAGLVLSVTLSSVQYFNLLWGFQVQFFGVELAAAASIACVVMGTPRPASLGFAIVFAAIALFTLSSGVVVLVLAAPLALWGGRPKAQVAVLVAAAVVLLTLYLYGYATPAGHSDPYSSLLHPGVIRYAISELGNPFGQVFRELHIAKYLRWDARLGAAGLALFLVAALLSLRRKDRIDRVVLVFVGIGTFAAGMALLTALGRLKFGADQALDARYASPMLLFWLSLAMLGIRATRDRFGLRLLAMGLSLPVLLGLAWAQPIFARVGLAWAMERRQAETALLAGVADETALRAVYPDAAHPQQEAGRLKAGRLAIFANPWSRWLDTPLAEHVHFADLTRCRGGIEQVTRLPAPGTPQWRVSGWAWENPGPSGLDQIVITDKSGRVVGYALGGYPSKPGGGGSKHSGWRGHFAAEDAASVRAYALIDGERTACPLASSAASP